MINKGTVIGNGGAVARDNKQPYSTEGEMVSPLTKARSAKIGSDSDHQRGVSPYESNPVRDDLECEGEYITVRI